MGWTFPTTEPQTNETLVEAGKRAATETFGDDLIIYKMGNAPAAVNLVVYENNNTEDVESNNTYFGEKTFYFHFQRDEGNVNEGTFLKDHYAWLTRDEMVERVFAERGKHMANLHKYLL